MTVKRLAMGVVLAGFLGAAARAGDPFGLGGSKKDKQLQMPEVFLGEITSLSESSFQVKPWNPDLPRRVLVTATPETRYWRQEEGRQSDLKAADRLLVVEEPRDYPRMATPSGETPADRTARETREKALRAEVDAKPAELRAVLLLPPALTPLAEGEMAAAKALLLGAAGSFKGKKRGGLDHPGARTPLRLVVVTTPRPLAGACEGKDRTFRLQGDTLVLRYEAIKPEDLRRGKTVMVHAVTPPGADAAAQAMAVAVVPRPRIPAGRERQLIIRERGGKS